MYIPISTTLEQSMCPEKEYAERVTRSAGEICTEERATYRE